MSYIAGIDYDSNAIDVAIVDEDDGRLVGFRFFDLACGPGDAFARARRVRDLLPPRGSWADAGVVAVALEEPFTRDKPSLATLMRVQGAIVACLPRGDVDVAQIPVQRWKTLLGLKSNADKAAVTAWARSYGLARGIPEIRIDFEGRAVEPSQDAIDAYAIATALRRARAENLPLRRPRKPRAKRGVI